MSAAIRRWQHIASSSPPPRAKPLTIAITGFEGGPARTLANVAIHVESTNYGVVEDAHQACMHLLAQFIRQSRMSSAAVAAWSSC